MPFFIYALVLFLLAGALVPISLAIAGWSLGYEPYIALSKDIAALISPIITIVSLGIAAFVAYATWLSPFRPVVQARPFLWRLGPGTPPPCPFNVVMYLTVFNEGATSGVLSDLLLEIELPKGKWVMEPFFIVKPDKFYQDLLRSEIKILFSPEGIEGPFTPIFLAARSQVTKAVSFCPGIGKDDFDFGLIEVGQHPVKLFARFDQRPELTKIVEAKIIFEPDILAEVNAGKTVSGEVRHRDTNVKALPRK